MDANAAVTVLPLFGGRDNKQTEKKKKKTARERKKEEARNHLIVFVRTTEMPFVIEFGKRTKKETNFRLFLFSLVLR